MNLDLAKLLRSGEWNDVEFKEARTDVPKVAFEAVSAFANTSGGYSVFGVTQTGENYEITGVEKPDKIQNDFLSVLHADLRINHDVEIKERKLSLEGKLGSVLNLLESRPYSLQNKVYEQHLQQISHITEISSVMSI
jgi:ATP-dependent DNA helicase RecG